MVNYFATAQIFFRKKILLTASNTLITQTCSGYYPVMDALLRFTLLNLNRSCFTKQFQFQDLLLFMSPT